MPAAQRRTPADRQPKLKRGEYAFTHDGETYVLPPAAAGADKVKGKYLRDAMLNEDGELALAFATLEACGVVEAALKALYDKPTPEMMSVLSAWMKAGDGDGAGLGESSSSSS